VSRWGRCWPVSGFPTDVPQDDTVGESSFWFLIGQYKVLKDIDQEKIFDSGRRWKRMPLALV
jgi:hypothetical protein